MNIETGDYVEAASREEALEKLLEIEPTTKAEDVVMIEAHEEQMRRLQDRIRQAEHGRR